MINDKGGMKMVAVFTAIMWLILGFTLGFMALGFAQMYDEKKK